MVDAQKSTHAAATKATFRRPWSSLETPVLIFHVASHAGARNIDTDFLNVNDLQDVAIS